MNKIVMWCKKNNIPYTVQQLTGGYNRIAIESNAVEYGVITSALYRLASRKGWKVESNCYNCIIHVYNKSEHEEMRLLNDQREELVNVFYQEYRKNQDGNKAKQVQYVYALNNGYLKAFESIYR